MSSLKSPTRRRRAAATAPSRPHQRPQKRQVPLTTDAAPRPSTSPAPPPPLPPQHRCSPASACSSATSGTPPLPWPAIWCRPHRRECVFRAPCLTRSGGSSASCSARWRSGDSSRNEGDAASVMRSPYSSPITSVLKRKMMGWRMALLIPRPPRRRLRAIAGNPVRLGRARGCKRRIRHAARTSAIEGSTVPSSGSSSRSRLRSPWARRLRRVRGSCCGMGDVGAGWLAGRGIRFTLREWERMRVMLDSLLYFIRCNDHQMNINGWTDGRGMIGRTGVGGRQKRGLRDG